ncbi:MAG TPA: YwiC-like family protein [Thermoanaerobaculia bacterium]|nr:YwiC-like family protein [Thermoanaerobaculia bacterium]
MTIAADSGSISDAPHQRPRAATTTRPALRPLALPTEHGGWGFLLEPVLLGLAVAPSWAGALLAAAATLGFLTRQPLRLMLQDVLRHRKVGRTRWCALFVTLYAAGALAAFAGAVAIAGPIAGWSMAIPFVMVAPLAAVQIAFDAQNKSRGLLPELNGPVAMSSAAAAIALAGGRSYATALVLAGLVIARGLPAVVYVRTLLKRAHGAASSSLPAAIMHAIGIGATFALWRFSLAPLAAPVAMTALLARAAWGLTHRVPPGKTVGWRESAWAAGYVAVVAVGFAGM